MKFTSTFCKSNCLSGADYFFYLNGVNVANKNNSFHSDEFDCPASETGSSCCLYNITLKIKQLTANNTGDYHFQYDGINCLCQSIKKSYIQLRGQGYYLIS